MIVCLDANVIIYYIERNPVWEPKVSARLKAIAAAGDSLAASEATLLECLVGPRTVDTLHGDRCRSSDVTLM